MLLFCKCIVGAKQIAPTGRLAATRIFSYHMRMDIISALVLGLLQGITEFLPVSSSGHLVLAESWFRLDWTALKSFDIAVHFGTLLAILIFFRKDYWFLLRSLVHLVERKTGLFRGKRATDGDAAHAVEEKIELKVGVKMCGYLVLGTVPAVLVGAFFGDFLDGYFRNPFWVAVMMIAVGVLFFVAEYVAVRASAADFNLKNTVLVGVAQAIALIPGVSRSGATISSGLALGLKREDAARFSFLLGSVAMAAASVLALYKAYKGDMTLPSSDLLATGVVASFISGYAAIAFLMRYLKNHTLHIFGVYRVVLGFAVLFFIP
jgi:undecaprenyl-diphosphatase